VDVDRQVDVLGGGKYGVEAVVVEKQSTARSHHEGADEAEFVDASPHLVGRRGRIVQRDGGESPEPRRVLRNLLCESIIHFAT
jgi:hypothetical protein